MKIEALTKMRGEFSLAYIIRIIMRNLFSFVDLVHIKKLVCIDFSSTYKNERVVLIGLPYKYKI